MTVDQTRQQRRIAEFDDRRVVRRIARLQRDDPVAAHDANARRGEPFSVEQPVRANDQNGFRRIGGGGAREEQPGDRGQRSAPAGIERVLRECVETPRKRGVRAAAQCDHGMRFCNLC